MTSQLGQLLAVQNGYLFLYQSELLQALDAAQAGGGRHMHLSGQGLVALRGISLQQVEQLQVNALSEWYRGSGKRYGLVMGYNNVRSYQEALDLLERPKRQTLALLR